MFAIIETGGKQYEVATGSKLNIEKLPQSAGERVSFDKVLLVADGEKISVGKPYLKNISVEAEILAQKRAQKISMMRYRSKTRHRRRKGHRQPFTEVKILKIDF